MGIAVVLLFPIGAMLMRTGLGLWTHGLVQILALALVLGGFGVGIKLADMTDQASISSPFPPFSTNICLCLALHRWRCYTYRLRNRNRGTLRRPTLLRAHPPPCICQDPSTISMGLRPCLVRTRPHDLCHHQRRAGFAARREQHRRRDRLGCRVGGYVRYVPRCLGLDGPEEAAS